MYGTTNIDAVGAVDRAFVLILGFAIVTLLMITAVMVYFIFRYNRKRHPEAADIEGSVWLETLWTVIPTLIVMLMFYFGWSGFKALRTVPEGAMEVSVKARMWSWVFEYPNGVVSNQLYVPVNEPVRLNITSEDVLHSLYVPAFRIKMDCVPGMNTYAWFRADRTGVYDILCAEYCGLRHAYMLSKVHVLETDEYQAWLEKESGTEQLAAGQAVYERLGCADCHAMDGSAVIAPALNDIAGTTRVVMVDGVEKEMTVDREYLKRSILNPETEIVKGFDPMMPPYGEEMTDEELDQLVTFLMGEEQPAEPVETEGPDAQLILEDQGCLGCHSTDGSEIAGPSFKGLYGRETVVIRNGDEVTVSADADYLRKAIAYPNAEIVKGYDPIMPGYDTLSEAEVQAILEYLKNMK